MKLDKVDLIEARAAFDAIYGPPCEWSDRVWLVCLDRLREIEPADQHYLDLVRTAVLKARRRNQPEGGGIGDRS